MCLHEIGAIRSTWSVDQEATFVKGIKAACSAWPIPADSPITQRTLESIPESDVVARFKASFRVSAKPTAVLVKETLNQAKTIVRQIMSCRPVALFLHNWLLDMAVWLKSRAKELRTGESSRNTAVDQELDKLFECFTLCRALTTHCIWIKSSEVYSPINDIYLEKGKKYFIPYVGPYPSQTSCARPGRIVPPKLNKEKVKEICEAATEDRRFVLLAQLNLDQAYQLTKGAPPLHRPNESDKHDEDTDTESDADTNEKAIPTETEKTAVVDDGAGLKTPHVASESGAENPAPPAIVKRGRGRPRKNPEDKKSGPGGPRKNPEENSAGGESKKKSRKRPAPAASAGDSAQPPAKKQQIAVPEAASSDGGVAAAAATPPKNKRGRPPKKRPLPAAPLPSTVPPPEPPTSAKTSAPSLNPSPLPQPALPPLPPPPSAPARHGVSATESVSIPKVAAPPANVVSSELPSTSKVASSAPVVQNAAVSDIRPAVNDKELKKTLENASKNENVSFEAKNSHEAKNSQSVSGAPTAVAGIDSGAGASSIVSDMEFDADVDRTDPRVVALLDLKRKRRELERQESEILKNLSTNKKHSQRISAQPTMSIAPTSAALPAATALAVPPPTATVSTAAAVVIPSAAAPPAHVSYPQHSQPGMAVSAMPHPAYYAHGMPYPMAAAASYPAPASQFYAAAPPGVYRTPMSAVGGAGGIQLQDPVPEGCLRLHDQEVAERARLQYAAQQQQHMVSQFAPRPSQFPGALPPPPPMPMVHQNHPLHITGHAQGAAGAGAGAGARVGSGAAASGGLNLVPDSPPESMTAGQAAMTVIATPPPALTAYDTRLSWSGTTNALGLNPQMAQYQTSHLSVPMKDT